MTELSENSNPANLQTTALPLLGDEVPRRGNLVSRFIGRTILNLTGWQLEGQLPDLPRFIVIAAPHTSNWDFVYGMAGVFAIGMDVQWMGKHTLFKRPFGGIMRFLGGIAIERTEKHGVVDLIAEEFKQRNKLVVAITPEGTRSRVEQWKTGFYYIAEKTGLPIITGFLDYSRKRLGFGPVVFPSGDMPADLQRITSFYKTISGKKTHLFNPDAIKTK
jgi:1-acyl-sn-glycerol-3-phosphate acyltransferase